MNIKLGVVMDPIEDINPAKDSTLAMLLAAQTRGWSIYYMLPESLCFSEGTVRTTSTELRVYDDDEKWFEFGVTKDQATSDLDAIIMRKDPPFDMDFIYATYLLEEAARKGTVVLNDPKSIRDCNEKIFALQFPECCPPLIVTASHKRIKVFFEEHEDIILKPLDGMGGASVFRVKHNDPNFNVIVETLTSFGQRQIMAQRFISEIKNGDKRILMINGEPVSYGLSRIPSSGETRGNLAAGGRGIVKKLTDREKWICSKIGPTLKEKGLAFVGLDVIGDYLTEINVTSPTCIREIDKFCDSNIGDDFMECVLTKIKST
ncbi:glutathione synthase [OM182 bacterium]|nr:glutathione synthase [OM182 bacterium]